MGRLPCLFIRELKFIAEGIALGLSEDAKEFV